MGIQLFDRCLFEHSKKVGYRSFKILLIALTIYLSIQQTANSDDDILGVNFNSDLGKNQLWSLNSTTDTKTLLQPSGFKADIGRQVNLMWMREQENFGCGIPTTHSQFTM